jgi:hypothetical protein
VTAKFGSAAWFREALSRFLMDIVVASLVAGGWTVYFESRLENSREHVLALEQSEQQFNNSHNQLVAEVGLYTNALLNGSPASDKDKILTDIINAQSQLLDLKSRLSASDYVAINEYGHELNRLSDAVNASTKMADLKPVFVAVQNLLEQHEQIDSTVQRHIQVTMF